MAKAKLQDAWERSIKSGLPGWINEIKPAGVKPTSIGAQLSFFCKCQGPVVQVPIRCAKGAHTMKIAAQLELKLGAKHGFGVCHSISATALEPQELQRQLTEVQAHVKRKQQQIGDLQEQLRSKKIAAAASVEPELKELKRLRQNTTKSTNRRAVPIDSDRREPFKHSQNKHDGLHHPETGVLAALRCHCDGSAEKALVLLKAATKRLGLRCI